jgi:hypothetical protein
MGSGAFLVETCRTLAARLVEAWSRYPKRKPVIPSDEDEELHARRLVAQRCLYGVDKNPLATDLAKLSLWLATLARDHEFTFLDHALKSGDSLVGLSEAQIAAAHWDTSKPGLPLFRRLVQDRVAEAMKGRAEIQAAPDDTVRAIQEQRHRSLEARLKEIRLIGDAVIAAFFADDKPKGREKKRADVESWLGGSPVAWEKLAAIAATLEQGAHPLTPFHWQIEFPEVFAREYGGFDAFVGNPPFMGGTRVTEVLGDIYADWLSQQDQGSNRRADLVTHFFRRAFQCLRDGGALGLISTNTIAQGDTQEAGLRWLVAHSGTIYRCVRRLKWPGEAAVVVSVVHLAKKLERPCFIDGREVSRISAWLTEGNLDTLPHKLSANAGVAFRGHEIGGRGFLFTADGDNGRSSTFLEMKGLVAADSTYEAVIKPYIGGEEVNSTPDHRALRYVIDLGNLTENTAKKQYPLAHEILNRLVRPERAKLLEKGGWSARRAEKWWVFAQRADSMEEAIAGLEQVIGICRVSPHMSFTLLPRQEIFSVDLRIIASDEFSTFNVLQSRVHEIWARFFCSSMKDDLRYSPSDCFNNFPQPSNSQVVQDLETVGRSYYDHRAALMVARNEGMTKTYNRFHDSTETAEDIRRLRELHAAMDRAVLEAYGWRDLAARTAPTFLDDTDEDDHTYQGRLFWPSDFRDEVLARLLALNAERHADEVRRGLAPGMKGKEEEDNEED